MNWVKKRSLLFCGTGEGKKQSKSEFHLKKTASGFSSCQLRAWLVYISFPLRHQEELQMICQAVS